MHKYKTEEARKEAQRLARLKWYNKPETKKHLAEYALKRRKRNPELRMFDCARYRAKRDGLDFSIEVSDIKIPKVCPIFKIKLGLNNQSLKGNSPTLDRVDSSKGYVKGNVRVISHRANSCKSDMTKEQIKRLYDYVSDTK